MNSHDPRHDEWLISILAGEEVSREARAATEGCAECRSALGDVSKLEAVLDVAGHLERESIGRAFPSPEGPVSEGLRRETRLPGRGRSRFEMPILRIAAAILVFAVIGVCYRQARSPDHPAQRGSGPNLSVPDRSTLDAFAMQPSGVVAEVSRFTFDATLPSGGSFQIHVYDPAAGGDPIFESPPLEEPRWSPDPELLGKLPNRFRWEVRVLDATGTRFARAFADVEIRSR